MIGLFTKMIHDRFQYEKNVLSGGAGFAIGIDEAGRGPLAGPVFAAAVCFTDFNARDPVFCRLLEKVRDSKQLSASTRQELFVDLTNRGDILWGCASASSETIDRINILEATKLAMLKAVGCLAERAAKNYPAFNLDRSCLVIDGNFGLKSSLLQFSVISGDRLVFSISAASIIAKVSRDRLMEAYETEYPGYGFSKHKGYGTKQHFQALKTLGVLPVHRKTFAPVARLWDNLKKD